jgi:D-serine deaminase-like pyridoxal phosphate-dependent protein
VSRAELETALAREPGAEAFAGAIPDVVVVTDVPPTFARHIVTAGRRIVCSDPAPDRDLVRDAQLRAADLEPLLRRMRRVELEALGANDVPRRTTG